MAARGPFVAGFAQQLDQVGVVAHRGPVCQARPYQSRAPSRPVVNATTATAHRHLLTELNDLIDTRLAAHRDGARLGDADAARLSVLLGVPCLRDAAWEAITPQELTEHQALWTDMTRRSVINTAACASLLAFTCWLTGNGVLAGLALERALTDDPDYDMAHLMTDLLRTGLSSNDLAFMNPLARGTGADPATA